LGIPNGLSGRRGDLNDTHGIRLLYLCHFNQSRRQELCEHEGAEVVCAKLKLVILDRLGFRRRIHNPSIVEKYMKFEIPLLASIVLKSVKLRCRKIKSLVNSEAAMTSSAAFNVSA